MLNSKNLKDFFFLITIGVLFIGFLYVLSPYLGVIIIALILVELFYPWYNFLKSKIKSTALASLIAGISVILTVVVPVGIVLVIVVLQATALVDDASKFWQTHDLVNEYREVLVKINDIIARFSSNPDHQVTTNEVQKYGIEFSKDFLNAVIDAITSTASGAFGMISKLFMLLIGIFSLFPLRNKMYETIKSLSPLENSLDDLFVENFINTTRSVIKSTFLIAIGMGVVGGFLFWLVGIEAPVFWGLMMTVFSIIPIGSGIVWIPASIYLVIIGDPVKGIFLFVAGVIMTNVDSLIRPRLSKHNSGVHPLLLAFTILGGLQVFGIMGFLYGPLIAVFFISMMKVYQEKFKD